MSFLDPRSAILVGSIVFGLMALVLLFMRRTYPRHIQGIGFWALASLFWFFSAILFFLRSFDVAGFFTGTGGNCSLIAGLYFYYVGCRRFLQLPTNWKPALAYGVVFTLVMAYFSYVPHGYLVRLTVFVTTTTILYGMTLFVLIKSSANKFPARLTQATLIIHTVIIWWRLLSAFMDEFATGMFQLSLTQTVYLGSFVVALILLSMGSMLMANYRLVQELRALAQQDPLTQLPNRRTLFQNMEREIARAQRGGLGPTLLLIHFANLLNTHLRKTDWIGRYGGEEFMAMLPETDLATAQQITKRIHEATRNHPELAYSVSIGVAVWQSPEDNLEALITRADNAVYKAKAAGRDRTCVE